MIVYLMTVYNLLCVSARTLDVWSAQPSSDAITNMENGQDNNTFFSSIGFAKIGLPSFFVILIFIASLLWKYCRTGKH